MIETISIPTWLSISAGTRAKLASILDIRKGGFAEVAGGMIVSDGYTNADLAGITIEKLQSYNGLDSGSLFENLVKLIALIENNEPIELKVVVQKTVGVAKKIVVKKVGSVKKAKKLKK